ncbi:hypothetical protein ACFXKR_33250 [Streptomyces violascens]|uniref:hypothetical protein n=1 Tax=Streptomyces violascens TaxID=67381 RepID=UPI0036D0FADD
MPVSVSVSASARRAAAVALAASSLLFAAACGGSDAKGEESAGKGGAKSTASSGAAKSSVTEAQLKAALLTAEDVPAGWKADPTPAENIGKADRPECQKLLDLLQSEPAVLGAAARQTSNFEYAGQQVFGFDGDKAAGYLKGFDATLTQCASFALNADGGKVPIAVKPLTVDKAGDEAHGYELVLDAGPMKMGFHTYVVRKGGAMSTLMAKGKQPVGIPEADFKTVTATVAKKLDQAIKG